MEHSSDDILLNARYGEKNWLRFLKENETHKEYILDSEIKIGVRGIEGDNGNIIAVDPSGGPFIEIGYFTLNDGSVLQEISKDWKLIFKKK